MPREWTGSDKPFAMKRILDGHISPANIEVDVDMDSATYDPANPRHAGE